LKAFQLWLCRRFLPRVLAQQCENLIPRSGSKGAAVDCFTVSIDKAGEPHLLVKAMADDELKCLSWNGARYADEATIPLPSIDPTAIFTTHYRGLVEIRYFGILDLALGRTFLIPYARLRLSTIDQYLFNKKKLVTKARMDLLRLLVDRRLNGKVHFDSIDLMTELYSIKWVSHPDKDSQRQKLEFYLESLVTTGELTKLATSYHVAGKALHTIEEHEEQERRHAENVKIQYWVAALTLIAAFFAAAQAGIVKLPTVLDLSKPAQNGARR